jgi:L-2-hydroxyglutarate oxidase LhgO
VWSGPFVPPHARTALPATKLRFETSPGTVLEGEAVQETYRARYIVNCAGNYADKVAALVGDHSFKIKVRSADRSATT